MSNEYIPKLVPHHYTDVEIRALPARTREFLLAYLACAEWAGLDDEDQAALQADDEADYVVRKQLAWAFEDVELAIRDCTRFLQRAGDLITERGAKRAGHDFFLTRNGHGAGFWDGDWPINGDKLTEIAQSFPNVCVFYLTDTHGAYIEASELPKGVRSK